MSGGQSITGQLEVRAWPGRLLRGDCSTQDAMCLDRKRCSSQAQRPATAHQAAGAYGYGPLLDKQG